MPKQAGRNTGGVRFAYGALAYLLKNRTYLGEMGHKGAWYPGEHQAIVEPALFIAVQELLKHNSVTWPAPGSEDTELGVLMEREVDHGEAEVYTRVQA